MQSGNHETYTREYNYVDSLSCYEKTKIDKNDLSPKKMLVSANLVTDYFLDVYVPLLFASIVDVHLLSLTDGKRTTSLCCQHSKGHN